MLRSNLFNNRRTFLRNIQKANEKVSASFEKMSVCFQIRSHPQKCIASKTAQQWTPEKTGRMYQTVIQTLENTTESLHGTFRTQSRKFLMAQKTRTNSFISFPRRNFCVKQSGSVVKDTACYYCRLGESRAINSRLFSLCGQGYGSKRLY